MYWQIKEQTIMEDDCFYDLKYDWKGCVLCLCLDRLPYTYNENNYFFDLTYGVHQGLSKANWLKKVCLSQNWL